MNTTASSMSNIDTAPSVKDAKWCVLCNRYVTPQKRGGTIPFLLGITAISGAVVSIAYDSLLTQGGQYANLASAYLSAFLNWGLVVFLVIAFGAFLCALEMWLQPKRCPVCNSETKKMPSVQPTQTKIN